MSKFLRFRKFRDVTPAGLDGHVFKLSLDVGKIVGTEFVPDESGDLEVWMSDSLQTIWGIPDSQLQSATGSLAASTVTHRVNLGYRDIFQPLRLSTFSPPALPADYASFSSVPLVPIPQRDMKLEPAHEEKDRFSILSDDISDIRDKINTLSTYLLGDRLLQLPQERALIDMYKEARTDEQFSSRLQSLAGLTTSINKSLILQAFKTSEVESIQHKHDHRDIRKIAPILILEELLALYSTPEDASRICTVFKRLNNLRQGYPVHGDNAQNYLGAIDFFKLQYPIEDFSIAWDTILGKYFKAMRDLLKVLTSERKRRTARG
ncbi:MAG: hypothetical protein WD898_02550 [Candidatus Paceibacterota bacterium]